MCLENLTLFDALDEGLDNETICETVHSNASGYIRSLRGRQVALYFYLIEGQEMLLLKRGR